MIYYVYIYMYIWSTLYIYRYTYNMMYTVIPCLGLRIRSCFIWGALCLVCKALGQRTVVWCLSLLQPTFGHLQTLPEVRRRWAPVEFSAFEYIGSESIHGCCVAIYIYMVRATNIHVYIYKFTHIYIYIYMIYLYIILSLSIHVRTDIQSNI